MIKWREKVEDFIARNSVEDNTLEQITGLLQEGVEHNLLVEKLQGKKLGGSFEISSKALRYFRIIDR